MFLAHSFRLRDPWQCEPNDAGGVRWTRVFHRPTGLEPDDRLVLVISGLPADTELTVNGTPLGATDVSQVATGVSPAAEPGTRLPSQFDLTQIVADSNRIELLIPPTAYSLQPTASPPPFPYDARLAILAAS